MEQVKSADSTISWACVLQGVQHFAAIMFIMTGRMVDNSSAADISVNVTNVINRYGSVPVGINMDFLADTQPADYPIDDALIELGAGSLRFPMGELADNYLFAVDGTNDFSSCAIRGSIFPFNSTTFVNQTNGTFLNAMTTARFVELAKKTEAKPFFVVGIDALLADRSNGQTSRPEVEGYWATNYTAVSKEAVYSAVSNWVQYVKTLGIEGAHWEIGNECYLDNPSVGGWIPEKYAEVVNDLSEIIKSVDPAALVGCNGGTYYCTNWWDRIFPIVENSVDFAVTHQYFNAFIGGDYTNYMGSSCSLTPDYDLALKKRNATVSSANRDRIKFCVTEFSSLCSTSHPNDLGKALMNFNLIGDLLKNKATSDLQFWITRYVSGNKFTSGEWNGLYKDMSALDDDNNLLPMGQSLRLWTQFFYPCFLDTTSNQSNIVAYAVTRTSDHALNVLILNRSTSGQSVTVSLNGFDGNSLNTRWQFGGTNNPNFLTPALTILSPVSLSNNTFTVWAMPCSVTVVEFAPKLEMGIKYNIISRNSGSLLELSDPYTDGGNAEIWEDRDKWEQQQWTFVDKDTNGFYEIVNQAQLNGTNCYKRIEYANPWGNPADTNVVGWADRGSWAKQRWSVNFYQGWAVLLNKADTNKALEVVNGSITNGSNVQVGNYQPGWAKQHWLIVPAE